MGIVDIVILIILLFGAIIGFKRGLLPQAVSLAGFLFIIIGAFLLKNPLSEFLYEKMPFFPFSGVLKGVTIINILLYEVVALAIIMFILWIIYKVVMGVSRVFEKILKITIIFEIPSKLLGALLGLIENFMIVFIVLYVLSLPFFNIDLLKDSKFRKPILERTPILNKYAKATVNVGEELWSLTEKYQTSSDPNAFNLEALDVLLKYKITTVKSIDKLVENDKLQIDEIENVLAKYRNYNNK